MLRQLAVFLLAGLMACSTSPNERKEIKSYFKEIALGAEFGDSEPVIRKWNTDMLISTAGDWPDHLHHELIQIIYELNELIESIEIRIVDSLSNHNYMIFIGDPQEYVRGMEPSAGPYVEANYGMFWVYWEKEAIDKGSMYVDPQRASSVDWQKHLLREELTQSLGLMNDSHQYDDSIFFQGRSYTTVYSDIDKALIRLLYNDKIKAGMTWSEIEDVLSQMLNSPGILKGLSAN